MANGLSLSALHPPAAPLRVRGLYPTFVNAGNPVAIRLLAADFFQISSAVSVKATEPSNDGCITRASALYRNRDSAHSRYMLPLKTSAVRAERPKSVVKGPIRCHKCQLLCRDAEQYLSHACKGREIGA